MKNFAFIIGMAVIMSLSACQNSSPTVDGKTHVYNLTHQCPTLLEMKTGESLLFEAPENSSTGYRWQLVQPLKNFKVEESYGANDKKKSVVGAGDVKTFQFYAEKPGQDLIELVYVRAWESNQQPAQHWQCRIRVY